MRILLDATGAPHKSGGMEVWARESLSAWAHRFPEDRILVIGSRFLAIQDSSPNLRVVEIPAPNPMIRAFVQMFIVPTIFFFGRFERIFSINAVLSPFLWNARAAIINHDWRHVVRPAEFTFIERLYRKIWVSSTRNAEIVIAISPKTAEETGRIVGRKDVIVVPPGGDHLDRVASRKPSGLKRRHHRFILTFAQHTNKRPDRAIEVFASLIKKNQIPRDIDLFVLGARGRTRVRLNNLADSSGVPGRVKFFDFVALEEYKWLVSEAELVVLLSTDEGFGLPIAESLRLGVPIVISRISGVGQLFPLGVIEVEESGPETEAAILEQIGKPKAGQEFGFSWETTVELIRQSLV